MKSGKYTLGYKTCLKTLRSGKGKFALAPTPADWCFLNPHPLPLVPCVGLSTARCLLHQKTAHLSHQLCLLFLPTAAKLVIICNNCPAVRKSEVEYYAMLAKTGVHHYGGSKWRSSICLMPSQYRLPWGFGAAHLFVVERTHCPLLSSPSLRAFPPDNVDLGTACGKYYRVSVLAITDPGAWRDVGDYKQYVAVGRGRRGRAHATCCWGLLGRAAARATHQCANGRFVIWLNLQVTRTSSRPWSKCAAVGVMHPRL